MLWRAAGSAEEAANPVNVTTACAVCSASLTLQVRLLVKRELLANSGLVFVQIGDDHVDLVPALVDKGFSVQNTDSQVSFFKIITSASCKLGT
jgi:hypothetical protein